MGIEVKNLVKTFDKKVILDNISFKVEDGKILSIVGFSGSGKSTVLKLISGLIAKDVFDMIKHCLKNKLITNAPTFDNIYDLEIQYNGYVKY